MARKAPNTSPSAVVQYDNADAPPAYVESVQGMLTPQGALHLSFFSEYLKHRAEIPARVLPRSTDSGEKGVEVSPGDPFGFDGEEICVVRRVEANLIMTEEAVRRLLPWLQTKLNEMEQFRERKKSAKTSSGGGTP